MERYKRKYNLTESNVDKLINELNPIVVNLYVSGKGNADFVIRNIVATFRLALGDILDNTIDNSERDSFEKALKKYIDK